MGNLLQPVTFLPRPTCYPTWYCEIATGAKRPLAMTIRGAFTMMTLPCTSCQRSAGSGCPRPYDRLLWARAVIIIRGGGDAAGDDLQRGIGGPGGRLGDELVFRAGEIRQNPVRQIVIGMRLRADADLDAGKLWLFSPPMMDLMPLWPRRRLCADAQTADQREMSSNRTSTRSGGSNRTAPRPSRTGRSCS